MKLTDSRKKLVKKVRTVDPFAANWLSYAITHPELFSVRFNSGENLRLSSLMRFSETPQGYAYWWEIAKKLNEW